MLLLFSSRLLGRTDIYRNRATRTESRGKKSVAETGGLLASGTELGYSTGESAIARGKKKKHGSRRTRGKKAEKRENEEEEKRKNAKTKKERKKEKEKNVR